MQRPRKHPTAASCLAHLEVWAHGADQLGHSRCLPLHALLRGGGVPRAARLAGVLGARHRDRDGVVCCWRDVHRLGVGQACKQGGAGRSGQWTGAFSRRVLGIRRLVLMTMRRLLRTLPPAAHPCVLCLWSPILPWIHPSHCIVLASPLHLATHVQQAALLRRLSIDTAMRLVA